MKRFCNQYENRKEITHVVSGSISKLSSCRAKTVYRPFFCKVLSQIIRIKKEHDSLQNVAHDLDDVVGEVKEKKVELGLVHIWQACRGALHHHNAELCVHASHRGCGVIGAKKIDACF